MTKADKLVIHLNDGKDRAFIVIRTPVEIDMTAAWRNPEIPGEYTVFHISIQGQSIIDFFASESVGLAEQLAALKDERCPPPEQIDMEWIDDE